ncbi:MAG TPA: PilT/PilU family type 4a pilus ATPase [Acidimicrobiia bacterium]|nr:PilT/PilU family type 4a pilus ATPase [Acidimicrobiia bacterium]
MLDLDRLLRFAVDQGASDVHVKVGARPRLRIDGRLREAPFDTVEPADSDACATAVMPEARATEFRSTSEAEFMYAIAGLGRFRVSAFRQRGWVGLVLRRVLPGIPNFEALSLPDAVSTLSELPRGLVLVTGLAGSGKTATLAAIVDHVNSTRDCHVVTIEDPVEVLHADKRALVDQREVGSDTPSAQAALVRALRQDPDVIMVSQLRDAASAWAALQAAETGHLVLSSMPTTSAVDTIERLVDLFQPHQQRQTRTSLASALRGIVSQRLLPRAGGRGRVPAVEVLVVNSRVAERIREPDRLGELAREMIDGDLYGMQTFDQSLVFLYRSGLVTRADALAQAEAPSELRFELDRADFERGEPPRADVAAAPEPAGPRAVHEPGDPLPQRVRAV